MVKAIIVTGTPGTGKTTIAKEIAKILSAKYIDVHKLILNKNLPEGYDKSRKCLIVDEKNIKKEIETMIKRSDKVLVIDSHLSHFISPKNVAKCIITKCSDLKELKRRLKRRKYSKDKIRENLDCEIFDVCLHEAEELGHDILIIDTSEGIDYKNVIRKIKAVS